MRITYDGVAYNFTTIQDLSNQIGLTLQDTKDFVRSVVNRTTDRIIVNGDDDYQTIKINIQQPFSTVIQRKFNRTIPNRFIIRNNIVYNNIAVDNKLKPQDLARLRYTVTLTIRFSEDIEVRTIKGSTLYFGDVGNKGLTNNNEPLEFDANGNITNWSIPPTGIFADALEKVKESTYYDIAEILNYELHIFTSDNDKELEEWNDGTLRDINYKLTEWANIMYQQDTTENCLKQYLLTHYSNIPKAEFKKIGHSGITVSQLKKLCKRYDINYYFYDKNGKLKESSTIENNDIENLRLIIYNNHIYPISGTKPKRITKTSDKIIIVDNARSKLLKLYNNKIVPHDIKISELTNEENETKVNIQSFVMEDGTKYLQNPQFKRCYDYLARYNLEHYIYDTIQFENIVSILQKKFITDDLNSFIPNHNLFLQKGLTYNNGKKLENREIHTIDKNKAYMCAMYYLPYLISVDWRLAEIIKNPTTIVDHYLYIIEAKTYTDLIPQSGKYWGYILKLAKQENIDFILLEGIPTTVHPNKFPLLLDEMMDTMSESEFKANGVRLWGNMCKNLEPVDLPQCNGIFNDDEASRQEGITDKLDDNVNIKYTHKTTFKGVYTMSPIAIQILDMARIMVHNKIKELNIKPDDIIELKTDAISYYGKLPESMKIRKPWPQNFHDWKEIQYIPVDNDLKPFEPTNVENVSFFYKNPKAETHRLIRELHLRYAGTGKTYEICHEIVPKLIKQGIKYKVLTPSHLSQTDYMINNINCEVIQKDALSLNIPDEDFIIIDELSMLDKLSHDLLFKLSQIETKQYMCFGDYNQLLNVDREIFNTPQYNMYIFNNIIDDEFKNYRNNFTKKYYDSLINETVDPQLEVIKHSKKKFYNADVIITYRKKTAIIYNEKMLEHLDLTPYSKGVKYICRTNDFMTNPNEAKRKNIYNCKQITIKKPLGNNEYLMSDDNVLTKKQLDNKFKLAYALNIHQLQGSTVDSYYFCQEDAKFIKGREAYVIISRLRTKTELI